MRIIIMVDKNNQVDNFFYKDEHSNGIANIQVVFFVLIYLISHSFDEVFPSIKLFHCVKSVFSYHTKGGSIECLSLHS